jgi:hypothetical protein
VRFEVVPKRVLEAGLGISLTNDLREIWQARALLGITYAFGS